MVCDHKIQSKKTVGEPEKVLPVEEGQDSFSFHSQDMMVAARAMAERKTFGQPIHDSGEDPLVAPPLPQFVKGLRRAIGFGRIAPAQAIAIG